MSMLIAVLLLTVVALVIAIGRTSGFTRPPRWQRDPIRVGQRDKPRRFLLTGATGFIGYRLGKHILEAGDELWLLTRNARRARDLFGPHATILSSPGEISDLTRFDFIVNLAGEPIFAKRWTTRRREQLVQSRLSVTQALVALIARLHSKPRALISMSAVGYYGVRGDEELSEADHGRPIFQSQLCQMWELAAQNASSYGVRVCRIRLGMVLGNEAGAFPRLVLGARMRVRTVLGTGDQWMSWIHIEDVIRLIGFCADNDDVRGAINGTAPEPVRQIEFAKALSGLWNPAICIRVPAQLLRKLLGEMAELLVDGQKVVPLRAQSAGFEFKYRNLASALAQLTTPRSITPPAEIFYDAFCPVCSVEMDGYCRAARRAGLAWRFADVSIDRDLMMKYGLDVELARRRVYVLDRSGALISGMEAIGRIWSNLPGWQRLGRLLQWPVVKPLAEHFYDFVLAPLIWGWNRRRRAQLASASRLH
ncbi:MAG: TIGR01777 family oxidoreductase [Povalibacter sp.]